MARSGHEVEVMGAGVQGESPLKGSFALNMLYRQQGWEVRKGFGTLAQLDSTMSNNPAEAAFGGTPVPPDPSHGYQTHLGSYAIRTDFGHDQILSAFHLRALTADNVNYASFADLYAVVIYDVTTNDRHEEILHVHTSTFSPDVLPMKDWHGMYASNRSDRFERFINATRLEPFAFTEYTDVVYLGNRDTGLFAYFPCQFASSKANLDTHYRPRLLDGVNAHDWARGYEESSLLVQVVPTPGTTEVTGEERYLDKNDFPNATLVTALNERLAFIDSQTRQVFFSDPQWVSSVLATNWLQVPTENNITAAKGFQGQYYFWTRRETFMYVPPDGQGIISGGTLVKLSDHIGCIGQNAVTTHEQDLIWCDENGVYRLAGMEIQYLSADIEQFFRNHLTNPMSSYWTQSGLTDLSTDPITGEYVYTQPNTSWRFKAGMVSVVYHQPLRAIMVCVPSEGVILVLSDGQWAIWSMESIVSTDGAPASQVVEAKDNIQNPFLVTTGERLFCIGGMDQHAIYDDGVAQGVTDIDDDTHNRSFYILEYGRGGGLDRNVDDEDFRIIGGKYRESTAFGTAADGYLYFEPPIELPYGFRLPNQAAGEVAPGVTWTSVTKAILVPLSFSPDRGPYQDWDIRFGFDNSVWRPVTKGATAEVDFLLPPERAFSQLGYAPGAPVNNTREVQVWDGGAPGVTGSQVHIVFDGSAGTHTHSPNINFTARWRNPIIYIPFYRVDITADMSGLALEPLNANFSPGIPGPADDLPRVFYWENYHLGQDKRDNNAQAQAVDWAYKSGMLGFSDGQRIRLRGVFAKLFSRGSADGQFAPAWASGGLLNMVVGSDYREWSSQLLDHGSGVAGTKRLTDAATLRSRLYDSSVPVELVTRTFRTGTEYGGDYLIDDEEAVTVAMSDVVKGEWASVMLYGFIRDRAEALRFESVRAAIRVRPGRRRRSHA